VPVIENAKDVLIELTEPSVSPNTLQINLAIDAMCQGKGLYISVEVDGITPKVIRIGKENSKVESMEVPAEIYPELGDRNITIKVFNKKDRIIYNSQWGVRETLKLSELRTKFEQKYEIEMKKSLLVQNSCWCLPPKQQAPAQNHIRTDPSIYEFGVIKMRFKVH
jgi:regulator of sigma D